MSPALFLYSRMDRIIRASSVQAYIARLRKAAAASGVARSIEDHQFPLGQHVACFWMSGAECRASPMICVHSAYAASSSPPAERPAPLLSLGVGFGLDSRCELDLAIRSEQHGANITAQFNKHYNQPPPSDEGEGHGQRFT